LAIETWESRSNAHCLQKGAMVIVVLRVDIWIARALYVITPEDGAWFAVEVQIYDTIKNTAADYLPTYGNGTDIHHGIEHWMLL
jgi:hypothetical protein